MFLSFKWTVTYCVKYSGYFQRNQAKLFQPETSCWYLLPVGRLQTQTFHNFKMKSTHACTVLLFHADTKHVDPVACVKITSDFLQIETSINTKAILLCTPEQTAFQLDHVLKLRVNYEYLNNYEDLLELVKFTSFKVKISCSAPFPIDGIFVHLMLCLEKSLPPACWLLFVLITTCVPDLYTDQLFHFNLFAPWRRKSQDTYF